MKLEKIHNPDVLTCIANLSSDEVFTPPKIVSDMLDKLPEEIITLPTPSANIGSLPVVFSGK